VLALVHRHDDQQTFLRRLPRSLPRPTSPPESRNLTSLLGSILLARRGIFARRRSRDAIDDTDNHYKDPLALAWRKHGDGGDKSLPTNPAARRALPPVHVAHGESLSHTRSFPAE
jgi:hypothetical protein